MIKRMVAIIMSLLLTSTGINASPSISRLVEQKIEQDMRTSMLAPVPPVGVNGGLKIICKLSQKLARKLANGSDNLIKEFLTSGKTKGIKSVNAIFEQSDPKDFVNNYIRFRIPKGTKELSQEKLEELLEEAVGYAIYKHSVEIKGKAPKKFVFKERGKIALDILKNMDMQDHTFEGIESIIYLSSEKTIYDEAIEVLSNNIITSLRELEGTVRASLIKKSQDEGNKNIKEAFSVFKKNQQITRRTYEPPPAGVKVGRTIITKGDKVKVIERGFGKAPKSTPGRTDKPNTGTAFLSDGLVKEKPKPKQPEQVLEKPVALHSEAPIREIEGNADRYKRGFFPFVFVPKIVREPTKYNVSLFLKTKTPIVRDVEIVPDLAKLKTSKAYSDLPEKAKSNFEKLSPKRQRILNNIWVKTVKPTSIFYGGEYGYRSIFHYKKINFLTDKESIILSKLVSPKAYPYATELEKELFQSKMSLFKGVFPAFRNKINRFLKYTLRMSKVKDKAVKTTLENQQKRTPTIRELAEGHHDYSLSDLLSDLFRKSTKLEKLFAYHFCQDVGLCMGKDTKNYVAAGTIHTKYPELRNVVLKTEKATIEGKTFEYAIDKNLSFNDLKRVFKQDVYKNLSEETKVLFFTFPIERQALLMQEWLKVVKINAIMHDRNIAYKSILTIDKELSDDEIKFLSKMIDSEIGPAERETIKTNSSFEKSKKSIITTEKQIDSDIAPKITEPKSMIMDDFYINPKTAKKVIRKFIPKNVINDPDNKFLFKSIVLHHSKNISVENKLKNILINGYELDKLVVGRNDSWLINSSKDYLALINKRENCLAGDAIEAVKYGKRKVSSMESLLILSRLDNSELKILNTSVSGRAIWSTTKDIPAKYLEHYVFDPNTNKFVKVSLDLQGNIIFHN